MHDDPELKRLHWRAHHRGTREADMLIGGYFDMHGAEWNAAERMRFGELLDEQDVDIMAWALGQANPPARFAGATEGRDARPGGNSRAVRTLAWRFFSTRMSRSICATETVRSLTKLLFWTTRC